MKNHRMLFIGLSCGLLIGLFLGGAVANSQGGSGRRIINLPNRNVNAPFSDAVMVGNTLYMAGRLGVDPKTNQIPSDVEQEARFMLDGFKAVLAEAGMTMDDIVSVQVFCSDVSLFDKFNGVYRTYFKKDFPARAFLGSGKLLRDAHFEMQAIAVKQ
ncbi:MAG TPA: RidA family protein [Blastocatellia bacterium]